jgi:integrase/recombinase XerC
MAKVVAPKMPKHLVKDIPARDLHEMFERFPWNEVENGARDQLLLLLLYTTGMRLSELIGLKWTDVDFARNSLRVLGKRNKVRILPLHPELSDLLKVYQSVSGGRLSVFERDNGEPLYPVLVYRLVNHYLRLFSHASKTSPHVLRHSFATHMLNNGANLMAIKDLLGHANLAATQVYTKNSFEKLKKIHNLHPRK